MVSRRLRFNVKQIKFRRAVRWFVPYLRIWRPWVVTVRVYAPVVIDGVEYQPGDEVDVSEEQAEALAGEGVAFTVRERRA